MSSGLATKKLSIGSLGAKLLGGAKGDTKQAVRLAYRKEAIT